MADETPAIQNKGLLITALVLAVIVVLLYNFQIERAVNQARGETVDVMVFARDLNPGDRVSAADMEVRSVSVEVGKGLGQVVFARDRGGITDEAINRAASKGSFVMWDHFNTFLKGGNGAVPPSGMGIYPLSVDRKKTPGAMLGVGDRISVWGMLPGPDGKLTSTCIIRGLKVRGIGPGDSQSFDMGSKSRVSSAKSQSSYDSIKVDITEDVRRQLENVISHVSGGLGVDKLNPDDPVIKDYPQITEEAKPFAKNAAGIAAGH